MPVLDDGLLDVDSLSALLERGPKLVTVKKLALSRSERSLARGRPVIGVLSLTATVHGTITVPHIPAGLGKSYHAFADSRTMYGIPNALNVVSNVFFALAMTTPSSDTFHVLPGDVKFSTAIVGL